MITRAKGFRRSANTHKTILTFFCLTVILLFLNSPHVGAQEQDNGQADDGTSRFAIEEIIVTARRRAETLQGVPGSVSAFSESRIAELQADTMRGLQYSVPNFYFDRGDASNAVIFLRGIGQNDSLAFVEPGVAVYVDDVYIARTQAAFLELFDVERVEVLRGPQGTLYGRNSPGGAVKLITRQPTDEFDAYLEAGAGRFNLYSIKGRVSGPIGGDMLKGKLAFSLGHRDGFSRNEFTGGRDGDTKFVAWRSSLLYEPSEDVRVSFSFDGKVDRPDTSRSPVRETPLQAFPDPVNDPFTSVIFEPNEDNFVVNTKANGLSDMTSYGFTLKVEWDVSDEWSLEFISSYREFEFDLVLDADGSPLSVLDISLFQDQEQFTEEFRVSYDAGSGFEFTGGVFYFHDFDRTLSGFDDPAAAFFGFPIIIFGVPSSGYGETLQETNSYAVFGDATISLTDRLSLEVGMRYTYDKKDAERRIEFFFDPSLVLSEDFPPFLSGVGVPGPALQDEKSFDAFTPRIVLSYDATEDIMISGSVSRGFKSGGFPGRAFTGIAFTPFEPESVWAFEGGVKSSWYDGRLVANIAYFYNRYRNLQVNGFGQDPATGQFVSLFTNAAAARIQGAELDLSARPLEALTINATVGFLDAEYKEFDTLVNGVITDVSGRDLVNSPKWNASLGATYQQTLSNGLVVSLHADAAYRGDAAIEITDSPNLSEDSYVILNAFVSIKTEGGHWEFRVGGTNLTDQETRVQGFNISEFSGVETSFFAPPRLYDFRLIYRY